MQGLKGGWAATYSFQLSIVGPKADKKCGSCHCTGLSEQTPVAAYNREGAEHLVLVGLVSEPYEDLQLPIIEMRSNAIRRVSDTTFAVIGSALRSPTALYLVDMSNPSNPVILKSSTAVAVLPAFHSSGRHGTGNLVDQDIAEKSEVVSTIYVS